MSTRLLSERTLRRRALYGAPLEGPGADEKEWPAHDAWPDDARVRIGTSGWAYDHWRGRFYPRDLPPKDRLAYASRRMPTVEVNSTYRRLPAPHVFDAWRDATPDGFLFAVKSPGTITHDKRLVDVDAELVEFLRLARRLRDRLGCILFQFPSSFRVDVALLGRFLEALPRGPRYAFELRHRSWYERDVYMLLAEHAAAFVVHDFAKKGSPLVETAPFVYLRLHGPSGRYRGSYDEETIFQWGEQVREWLARGFEVFVYLNNDERAKSVRDAARLRDRALAPAAAQPAPRAAARRGRPQSS